MAPSANRRSGHSRRAQYSTFIAYSAGVLGAVIGAAFLLVSIFNPGLFSGARAMGAAAAEPGGEVLAGTRQSGRGVVASIEGYFRAGSQNARLKRELREAKVRLVEAQAVASENRRLKALLGLAEKDSKPVVFTQITSSSASSTRRYANLASGSGDGVAVGMPVRTETGLVGRVLEVGRWSSRVLLVTDTESVVPVRRARDGLAAYAQGLGDGTLRIRLINLGINPLKKGDVLATSGSGGLYRPGTALAVVTRVTKDGAVARVLSDPATAEYVMVEEAWAPPPTAGPEQETPAP
ncbi:MAG: rod shape-determining protein MreC [Novosphingobium sp.]|nr:rod shape-determining protein MreC [Novosphingobium sp.]MCP5401366.1 rod shape-determining protein MreC [Novosphingobium sp.]